MRRAFLVAGDDQADDTGIVGNIAQRGDKGGDAALHVDCTAAVEQIAFHYRFERFARPAFTGRHNVQMPGKGEMAAAFSTDRKQVFHRPAMRRIGSSAPAMNRSTVKPNGSSIASIASNTLPRAGEMLSQAIRRRA
jgi:hypothetical protein